VTIDVANGIWEIGDRPAYPTYPSTAEDRDRWNEWADKVKFRQGVVDLLDSQKRLYEKSYEQSRRVNADEWKRIDKEQKLNEHIRLINSDQIPADTPFIYN